MQGARPYQGWYSLKVQVTIRSHDYVSNPSMIMSNIDEAVDQWMSYTFLFVRMLLNPLVYGSTQEASEFKRREVCTLLIR